MLKNKKIAIIILSLCFVLFLFTPILKKEHLTHGKAISFTSLTYKIISWDIFEQSDKPYNKTEFYIFPKNFNSTKKLWNNKENKLLKNGYGATNSYTTVEQKTDEYIVVSSINDSVNKNVTIDKKSFISVANEISYDEIKCGTKLTITNINLFSKTYQDAVVKIFRISPTTVETITIENTNNNQSDKPTNNQNNSSNTNESKSNNISSINSNIVEQPEKVDTTSPKADSSESTHSNIDLPMYEPKGFWFQNVHKYPDHYDHKSKLLMPYLVVEPENYDPGQKYPVILYFHGAGDGYPQKEDDEYEYNLRFNQRQAFQFVDGYIYCYE